MRNHSIFRSGVNSNQEEGARVKLQYRNLISFLLFNYSWTCSYFIRLISILVIEKVLIFLLFDGSFLGWSFCILMIPSTSIKHTRIKANQVNFLHHSLPSKDNWTLSPQTKKWKPLTEKPISSHSSQFWNFPITKHLSSQYPVNQHRPGQSQRTESAC